MSQPKCECGNCKYCRRRKWYLNNKEAHRRRCDSWKLRNVAKVKEQARVGGIIRRHRMREEGTLSALYRKHDLSRHYGVTPEWFDAKLAEQGGGCAICGALENNAKNRKMHVDHNHKTGENRGILCHRCNTALERVDSVPEWIPKVVQYLQKYLT